MLNQFVLVGEMLHIHDYENDVADVTIRLKKNEETSDLIVRVNDKFYMRLNQIEQGSTLAIKGRMMKHDSGSLYLLADKISFL
jgi:hypothetical protein